MLSKVLGRPRCSELRMGHCAVLQLCLLLGRLGPVGHLSLMLWS